MRSTKSLFLFVNLIFICAICITEVAVAQTRFSGLSHKKYNYNPYLAIHVVTIDLSKTKLSVVRAQDAGSGFQTVADMAQHFSALAAINGGFFRFKEPGSSLLLPAGILKINQQWHGIAYNPRGAIGWDHDSNSVMLDILQTISSLSLESVNLPINSMNSISMQKASLLSDSYKDTLTLKQNLALEIKDQTINNIYRSDSVKVHPGAYLCIIPPTTARKIPNTKIGDNAKVDIQVIPQLNPSNAISWANNAFIIGGGPLLIIDNKPINDFSTEKMLNQFINGRYARTAIGVLADQRIMLLVTESLAPEAIGLTIPELRDFMHNLGCVSALNLDGGGSSALYLGDQELVSGRPVADALLVLPR